MIHLHKKNNKSLCGVSGETHYSIINVTCNDCWNKHWDEEALKLDKCDFDQNNPVDCSVEFWMEIYSNPDYDMDHDHSMDH